jgi:hypothetical protein
MAKKIFFEVDKYKMLRKIFFIIIFISIIYIILPYLFEYYKKNDARKLDEEFSPKGRYKVEYYIPLDYKSILFAVDCPIFVKIYDFKEQKYIYESGFFEMGQGSTAFWPRKGRPNIIIGTAIRTQNLELEE